jgi:hypothetical protein
MQESIETPEHIHAHKELIVGGAVVEAFNWARSLNGADFDACRECSRIAGQA